MSNIDFFHIGALKVFAELGQLIDNDDHNKTKFTDIPYDIIKIIKIRNELRRFINKT